MANRCYLSLAPETKSKFLFEQNINLYLSAPLNSIYFLQTGLSRGHILLLHVTFQNFETFLKHFPCFSSFQIYSFKSSLYLHLNIASSVESLPQRLMTNPHADSLKSSAFKYLTCRNLSTLKVNFLLYYVRDMKDL